MDEDSTGESELPTEGAGASPLPPIPAVGAPATELGEIAIGERAAPKTKHVIRF